MSNQIVHTVCFTSQDAKYKPKEGAFVFDLPGDVPRFKASKIQLGSIEMALSQYSVEEEWNRLYYFEGFRVTPTNRYMTLECAKRDRTNDEPIENVEVVLPLTYNPITSWVRDEKTGRWIVRFKEPHGLFSSRTLHPIGDTIWWGDQMQIVAAWFGCVTLSMNMLEYMSPYELLLAVNIRGTPMAAQIGKGALCLPPVPSPFELCRLVNMCAYGMHHNVRMRLKFCATTAKMDCIMSASDHEYTVSVTSTPLSQLLGLGDGTRLVNLKLNAPAVTIDSEIASLWRYVSIPIGWYMPSQRPATTGQPHRLERELFNAMNRLYFPVPENITEGKMTAHFLMFVDPCGTTFAVDIPPGQYDPYGFAAFLQRRMTDLASAALPDVEFVVEYDDDRFAFACSVPDAVSGRRGACFSLLFAHPLQFDPSRIGFAEMSHGGASSYMSPMECRCACHRVDGEMDGMRGTVGPRGLLRVVEDGGQKKFSFTSMPFPNPTCRIVDYDADRAVVTLSTHIGMLPYAHALAPGDVVTVVPCRPQEVLVYDDAADAWVQSEAPACPLERACGRKAIVLGGVDDSSRVATTRRVDPSDTLPRECTLRLRVRPTPDLADCKGMLFTVLRPPHSFSLCTSVHANSLQGQHLGLPPGAFQWGLDGNVLTIQGQAIGGFTAPHSHNLDTPDYVLLHLDEGKRGTLLQHTFRNSTTTPLAKLVLTPMYRDERMLPRDSSMLSGESLTTFTLRFVCPDGTPYHFHGTHFSMALNLVKVDD